MNILITESQYNRVVLNEQSEDKVLFSDNNILIVAYGVDPKSGAYILPKKYGKISIHNKNNISPIIVNIEKSSPIFEYFDGEKKYSKQILSKQVDFITLDFNQSVGEGSFTGNLTFVYTIPGKAPVLKSINIPFVRIGTVEGDEIKKQNEIFYRCKSKYNSDLLKKATDWWRNWLNHPSTKDRFAKSFKYDKSTVEKHFAEYNKILSQIPIEYVISDDIAGGWVRPGLFINGYDVPININCRVANDYSENEALSLLIHEIQHILDDYHKFHPYESNKFDDWVIKKFLGDDTSGTPETNFQRLKKFLMTQGFDENASSKISDTYLWRLKNDEVHLRNPNEVMSTLSEIRRFFKLKPDQKITKEMIINSVNGKTNIDSDLRIFLSQWIYSKKTLADFLNFSNSIAMGKPNTTDRNLA